MSTVPDELGELLSAHLDGELSSAEEAELAARLAADPAARTELEGLAEVRAALRGLPAVEPPFGYYERMLRAGAPTGATSPAVAPGAARRGRRRWQVVGAAVAAAAAFVVLAGVTPATDRIAPPVAAFAARHGQMGPDGALPVDPGYEPMADADLPDLGARVAPAADLGTGWHRLALYHGADDVVHLVYVSGPEEVSVYVQAGRVDWQALPEGGHRTEVGAAPAWSMPMDDSEVMVVERRSAVYTVVGAVSYDELAAVAGALPDADEDLVTRGAGVADELLEHLGFDD